ncbi:hypothetical protein A0J61_02708 [Choanephora cucurbitarum]|uniref:Uncharacterized protein n=1 Tax=Choanephora cucurbitarum TaxID=101091 RepID=A0A1C7NKB3_9FUNG|nr:hypothetical protein A0J61_02708 [Choanephora cucurbitarum]
MNSELQLNDTPAPSYNLRHPPREIKPFKRQKRGKDVKVVLPTPMEWDSCPPAPAEEEKPVPMEIVGNQQEEEEEACPDVTDMTLDQETEYVMKEAVDVAKTRPGKKIVLVHSDSEDEIEITIIRRPKRRPVRQEVASNVYRTSPSIKSAMICFKKKEEVCKQPSGYLLERQLLLVKNSK